MATTRNSRRGAAGAPAASAPAVSAPAVGVATAACRTRPTGMLTGPGGWTGSKQCAEGARQWAEVPDADRACRADADCAMLEAHTCFRLAVARSAAARYRQNAPCQNPAAGPCWLGRQAAVCREGCCALETR